MDKSDYVKVKTWNYRTEPYIGIKFKENTYLLRHFFLHISFQDLFNTTANIGLKRKEKV